MEKKLLDYMKQVTDYYTKSNPLSASEVVALFLEENEKKEVKGEEKIQSSNSQMLQSSELTSMQMDIDELEKWRNKNNNKYAIRASLPITSHRKIIGKIIVRLKRIARHCLKWYIDPIVEQQNEFNGSLTASVNAIYNNDVVANQFMQQAAIKFMEQDNKLNQQASELTGAFNEIQKLTQIIEALKDEIHTLNNNQLELEEQLVSQKERLEEQLVSQKERLEEQLVSQKERLEEQLVSQKEKYEARLAAQEEKLVSQSVTQGEAIKNLSSQVNQNLTSQIKKINNHVDDLAEKTEENIHYLTYKFNKAKKEGIKVELVKAEEKLKKEKLEVKDNVELDYFLFENKFRGTEKNIKKRQEQYLPYYNERKNIVDLGCGRGEFLELMSEHHIPVTGIDVYDEFVQYCQDKGLNAKEADALSYMQSLEDNSIDGIFMSQVAEHLESGYLLNLLAQSYAKLQKGSYFIAETPNPTSLITFTKTFYLDPTHIKPVHPETFKFMFEFVGFKEVQIVYTESSKPELDYRFPLLNSSNVANLEEFNSGINCITELLLGGSLDYAVIARK